MGPYAVVFTRSSIAFGNLGAPAQFPEPLYWILLALQLFVCVLVVVCGTVAVVSVLGLSEPLGEPPYEGVEVAHDASLPQIESISLDPNIAVGAANTIMDFQNLPIINITFSYSFYVAVFCAFFVYALVKKDWKALLVGLSQIAIFILSIYDPAHSTLAFVIPAMAAQIMFFGAAFKGTDVIGEPPQ